MTGPQPQAVGFCFVFLSVVGHRCSASFSLAVAMGAALHCVAWASHCGGFSCGRAWALDSLASVAVAHRLKSCGSWAVMHGVSCPTARGTFPD